MFMEQVTQDLIKRIQIQIADSDQSNSLTLDEQLIDGEAENEELLAMRGVSNRIIRKLERQSRQEINRTGRPQRQLAKSHRERSYIE